ncbi:oligosaccharide flippase family protein [Nocardioides sp. BP30]|uniref:oligosaccharide flippase family protein n=1 Tax=Nocardioides sp. BP30 TaxID=3036374 RepID=UPI002469AA71|nr:oligosaccharide flippase family protein [Nocardioides sp. BP30]WGL50998.1 oligosaccharide flippase family protein [Nocardioides sp. BP30]
MSVDPGDLDRRLSGLVALLPARPHRHVVLAVSAHLAAALLPHVPQATVLDADGGDDDRSPQLAGIARRSVGLLVVDTRLHRLEPLLDLMSARGSLVTIGARGDYTLYPDAERAAVVWRRDWPLPEKRRVRRRLRHRAERSVLGSPPLPRVAVDGEPFESLADNVGADLRSALGERMELVGVHSDGPLVLRFRGERDVAVRVGAPLSDAAGETVLDAMLRGVPALADLVAGSVATGTSADHPWTASPWPGEPSDTDHADDLDRTVPSGRAARRLAVSARHTRRGWHDAERVAQALQTTVTGSTRPGWARAWVEATPAVPERLRAPFERSLQRLEQAVPTGWCHGALSPRALGHAGGRLVLSRWEQATPDAPLGLDWLLVVARRRSVHGGGDLAARCGELVDRPHLVPHRVGGRRWSGWDRRTRAALMLAGYLVHVRATEQPAPDWDAMRTLADTAETGAIGSPTASPTAGPTASPTASSARDATPGRLSALRGAVWLGLGAFVVKASQTTILLLLAALLDPSAMGVVAVGSLILNAASAFTDLGSSTALVYWRGDAEEASRSALTLALGMSILIVTVGWTAAPWLSDALRTGEDGTGVIRGLMLALPFTAVAGVSRELLRRNMAFGRRVMPDIVSSLVSVPVALVLALRGHGVYALVVSQLTQSVLVMLLCWTARRPVRPGWRRDDVDGLVAYGRHLAGANMVQLLMLNVDYLVVARVLGSGALGQYSVAFRLAFMPYLLGAVVIGGAAFPYLCRLGEGAVGRAAEQVCVLTLTLLIPLYVGMATLARQLELLGHQWAPAVPSVPWLAAYGLLLGLVQMCQVPLNSVDRTRDTFVLNLLHLVLLTGLLLGLAHLGVTAVAIAQLAAVAVTAAASLVLARRHVTGFSPAGLLAGLRPAIVGGAVMGAVILTATALMPWARVSAPGLVLIGAVAIALYAAVLWALTGGRPVARFLGGAA